MKTLNEPLRQLIAAAAAVVPQTAASGEPPLNQIALRLHEMELDTEGVLPEISIAFGIAAREIDRLEGQRLLKIPDALRDPQTVLLEKREPLDARRYRFIREPGNAIVYAKDRHAWGDKVGGHVAYSRAEELDAAIDAAIEDEAMRSD